MSIRAVDEANRALLEAFDRFDEEERKKKFFLGLDLGQAADYSALCALELQGADRAEGVYHCRHLHRWPLRTSYPAIADDVVKLLRALKSPAPVTLAVDATGVGAPVIDLLDSALDAQTHPHVAVGWLDMNTGAYESETRPPDVDLHAIQITGGDAVTRDGRLTRVPKRDLVSTAQVAFQTDRLKIAPALPLAQTLCSELQNFQVKISLDTAHDSYGTWREGAHDDLVLAVCLALWTAQHGRSRRIMWA